MKWYWIVLIFAVITIIFYLAYEHKVKKSMGVQGIASRVASSAESCMKPKTYIQFTCPKNCEKTTKIEGASQTFREGLYTYACKCSDGYFTQPIVKN